MDFVFASALQNFYEHMNGWPSNLRINRPLKLRPVIPKFHEPAHKVEKHHKFSCNLVKGLENCDCKGSEHIWGGHNSLGKSTKTMGPGSAPSTWMESVSVYISFETSRADFCVVLSEKGVEKSLEEEEERKCNGGVVCHAMSMDKFLTLGLELEESQ